VTSHVFKPPTLGTLPAGTRAADLRPLDARGEKEVLDEARRSFLRYGRGRIRTLRSRAVPLDQLLGVSDEQAALDALLARAQLAHALHQLQGVCPLAQLPCRAVRPPRLPAKQVKFDVLAPVWSAANKELQALPREQREGLAGELLGGRRAVRGETVARAGLNYLVELWAPSRRVVAVWHCALCDELLLDWPRHCASARHLLLFLVGGSVRWRGGC